MKNNTNTNLAQSELPSIFDKTVLSDLASEIGSDTLIPDLSEIFLRNLPDALDRIEKARAAQNTIEDMEEGMEESIEALRQNFHSLKGNAATLGMPKLRDICAELELTYRTSPNPTFPQESLDSLKIASEQAAQALKDFLATL